MAQSTHWHVGYNSAGAGVCVYMCVCGEGVRVCEICAHRVCAMLPQQKAVKLLDLLDKHSGWLLMVCAHTHRHTHRLQRR